MNFLTDHNYHLQIIIILISISIHQLYTSILNQLQPMNTLPKAATDSLIKRSLVNFQPPELERIRACIFKSIGVVARAFCESELTMLCAIRENQVEIGTVDNYLGHFCIFIEYQGLQVLKPVHAIH